MQSRFHQDALRRLAVRYEVDAAAERALRTRASALGITLPPSFVEWYSMRGGIALLGKHSNCDDPIEIERLGLPTRWRWQAKHDLVREGLLLFMVENQAVSIWAVKLHDGDDPPVVVARDPELEWRPCAPSFSTFIACQVWDHVEVFAEADSNGRRSLLQAQASPLRAQDLGFLRENFTEEPSTHGWPGNNQYRFQRGDSRILIWDSDDQADWFITASTEEHLAEVARELWRCGDLSSSLWSNDEGGTAVLKILRGQD
jgi:hypothetical protein